MHTRASASHIGQAGDPTCQADRSGQRLFHSMKTRCHRLIVILGALGAAWNGTAAGGRAAEIVVVSAASAAPAGRVAAEELAAALARI